MNALDIKSLKKASRQTVMPEILNRIDQIIKTKLIEVKKDFKLYWNRCNKCKNSKQQRRNFTVNHIYRRRRKDNFSIERCLKQGSI